MSIKTCLSFFILFFAVSVSFSQTVVTVEEVVQMAVQKNFDIRVAQTTAATQFTDKRFIYGAFLPTLNLNGSHIQNHNNSLTKFFPSANKADVNAYNVSSTNDNTSLQLAWTVFDGTKMFATRRRLLQLAELGETNIKNQIVNSVAATMTNFYNIVRQQEQLKATNEVMAVSLERVKLAERKLEVGTGAKPELLQAKVDLNAQRTLAVQQEILIRQIKDQMNGQLGFGLPENFEIADTIPINLTLTMDEVISGIENSNQTVLAAKKNLEIATTAIRENQASRLPVIQLTGAYNYGNTAFEALANPFQPTKQNTSYGYNYGVTVSVPILNNKNASRLIAQAYVTQSRMQAVYDQQKALAIVGVRNAFTSYENSKRILEIQEENIQIAKENVSIALAGFKRGITTFIELRTAQQSLSDAYNQLIAARYNAKAAEIELLRLKGDLLPK
jgi:outer membrane protein TolC